MIAGHNGAGKTTCYRKYLSEALSPWIEYHVDPDAVEREIRADLSGEPLTDDEFSRMAQGEADRLRRGYLDSEVSFSFETVFSDEKGDKAGFMAEARRRGYVVVLLAVGLNSPEKSQARVARRVAKGGHNVPADRIESRYPRVLHNFALGAKVASVALLVDNSTDSPDADGDSYQAFALFEDGELVSVEDPAPIWWERVTAFL